jgi:hypothetical protein
MAGNSRVKKRRVRLTAYEDYFWVHAFCFYLDKGFDDLRADELTWRDMCAEFSRLRNADGGLP